MQVRVRLFAGLRERAGADEVALELPEGARVRDVLDRMHELTAGVPVVMAVNQEYAAEDAPLHADDELALIPPVSGGSVGQLARPGHRRTAGARSARSSASATPAPAPSSHSSA